MKGFVLVLLICLTSVSVAWSAEKATARSVQREAEEDICLAYIEYREADNIFRVVTGGASRPGTYGGQLARQAEMKRVHFYKLLERYHSRYGKWYNPQGNPQICANNGR